MAFTAQILIKHVLVRQLSIKNSCSELHENPINGSITGTSNRWKDVVSVQGVLSLTS
jgi:hypothetical protein